MLNLSKKLKKNPQNRLSKKTQPIKTPLNMQFDVLLKNAISQHRRKSESDIEYTFNNHVHRIQTFFDCGKQYSIYINRKKGNGHIICKNNFIKQYVYMDLDKYNEYDSKIDYHIYLIEIPLQLIITYNNRKTIITIKSSSTIAELLKRFEEIPKSRAFYHGRLLQNEQTIDECNLKNGSTITLVNTHGKYKGGFPEEEDELLQWLDSNEIPDPDEVRSELGRVGVNNPADIKPILHKLKLKSPSKQVLENAVQLIYPPPPPINSDKMSSMKVLSIHKRKILLFSEPIIEALKDCGLTGIKKCGITPDQAKYLQKLREDKVIRGTREEYMCYRDIISFINKAPTLISPTFQQFKKGFIDTYPDSLYKYGSLVAADFRLDKYKEKRNLHAIWKWGTHIIKDIEKSSNQEEKWVRKYDNYKANIMLEHLYTHGSVHNGLHSKHEIEFVLNLLGDNTTSENKYLNTQILHSILHSYDSLYMLNRNNHRWKFEYNYLDNLYKLIPNLSDRRNFFGLVNVHADKFLQRVAHSSSSSFSYPYIIKHTAFEEKQRQYRNDMLLLLPSFTHQLQMSADAHLTFCEEKEKEKEIGKEESRESLPNSK